MIAAQSREREQPSIVLPPRPAPVPVPAPTPQAAPVETVDLLRRLATPIGSEAIEPAARRLAERLEDLGSIDLYRKACRWTVEGRVTVKVLIAAWKRATGDGAARRGAVFTAFVVEHCPEFGAQKKPTPGHTRQSSPGAGLDRVQAGMPNSTRRLTP
jgi:hypothetical protein